MAAKDKAGNVVVGRVVDIESQRSMVYGDRRVVATIGLTDMVVVDTPDATLVCPKSRAQDVKQFVEILKQQSAPEHLEHLTVHRPWGSYTILEEGPGYKVKRVTVNAGWAALVTAAPQAERTLGGDRRDGSGDQRR